MLKQKFLLSYGLGLLSSFLGSILGIIVARICGPSVMGTIAFGLSFVSMFKFITDLGLNTTHIKFISEGGNTGEKNKTFLVLKSFTTILFLIILLAVVIAQVFIFKVKFESGDHKIVVLLYIVIACLESIYSIPLSVFIARIERAKVVIPSFLQTITTKTFRVIVALLGFGAVALTLTSLFFLSVTIVVMFHLLLKKYSITSFNKKLAVEYIKCAMPITIATIFLTLYTNIDCVLLQYLENSREVGYYSVGFSISVPVRLFGNAASGLFFPVFSEMVSQQNTSKIIELIEKYKRFLILFVLPSVILGAIFSPVFVPLLLGSKYLKSIHVVSLVVLAMFIYIYRLPFGNLIFGFGKFKEVAIIRFTNLIFYIAIIYLLVSKKIFGLGATGTSIAFLLSNMILLLINMLFCKRLIPGLKIFTNVKPLIYLVFMCTVLYSLFLFFMKSGNNFFIYMYPVIFLCTVYGVFSLSGLIKKSDWKILLSILDYKSVFAYVKKDLKE